MIELDLLVRMKIMVPEKLNEQLKSGEPEAFQHLERYLKRQLNEDTRIILDQEGGAGSVTKLQIEDAGPYNDAGQWGPSKFYCSEHNWQEQPGEPPVDVCNNCGEVRR